MDFAFEGARRFWDGALGISGPQWMIIVALGDIDRGEGASLDTIAGRLAVSRAYVEIQSRLLERKGFVGRPAARARASLTLTDKARQRLAEFDLQLRNAPTAWSS